MPPAVHFPHVTPGVFMCLGCLTEWVRSPAWVMHNAVVIVGGRTLCAGHAMAIAGAGAQQWAWTDVGQDT